jgi:catechol 2,3-dioxygenase-like lactoylglutathione lyase family enzyme
MDRRQLLKTLGLTGAGAFVTNVLPKGTIAYAAAAAQTATEGGKVFPATTVNHLSIDGVADYAKTRDWYVDLFGMRVVWDNGNMCTLEMGPLKSPNGMYVIQGKPGDKATVAHIAFGIPDWWSKKDAIKAEMDRHGLKGIRSDGEAGWSCNTPSGYLIQPVPEKDEAMYPGAGNPCAKAKSDACKSGWESGLKNLETLPKPSGKGFKCAAFSRIVLHTPDIGSDRDFFRDLWGMKVISDKEDGENPECLLKFGQNTLSLRKITEPGEKPYCNEYSFLAQDYNKAKAEAELKRRGLNPELDAELGWVVSDPNGLRIGVRGA